MVRSLAVLFLGATIVHGVVRGGQEMRIVCRGVGSLGLFAVPHGAGGSLVLYLGGVVQLASSVSASQPSTGFRASA